MPGVSPPGVRTPIWACALLTGFPRTLLSVVGPNHVFLEVERYGRVRNEGIHPFWFHSHF